MRCSAWRSLVLLPGGVPRLHQLRNLEMDLGRIASALLHDRRSLELDTALAIAYELFGIWSHSLCSSGGPGYESKGTDNSTGCSPDLPAFSLHAPAFVPWCKWRMPPCSCGRPNSCTASSFDPICRQQTLSASKVQCSQFPGAVPIAAANSCPQPSPHVASTCSLGFRAGSSRRAPRCLGIYRTQNHTHTKMVRLQRPPRLFL